MSLKNKKILLAVTGGIAAYKTPSLVRLLIKKGAEVRVVCTPSALDFVTPLTLSVVSKNEVITTFEKENKTWNNHVELALWADVMLIAPATANTLSAIAHGSCQNILMATYLSAKCPVVVAPAMDLDMYKHPATQRNLDKIKQFGNRVIPAVAGELASGLSGEGRMEEPENIVQYLQEMLKEQEVFSGKKILITAGPTYEAIDPVRFIGNHSSGKMGFAIAQKAAEMGAEVVLVSGPTTQEIEHVNVQRIDVVSALEMQKAVEDNFEEQDIFIMAAAVADYRPVNVADKKIKKKEEAMEISLVKNPDILKSVGSKKTYQYVVGFALETDKAIENAKLKLKSKNADMVVVNSLQDKGAGFGTDTNKVSFVTKQQSTVSFDLKNKNQVAQDILNFIAQNI